MQKMLEGVLGNDFSDNICGMVLGEHSSRLQLKRITAKQGPRPLDSNGDPNLEATVDGQPEQEWLDTFWQKTKLDDLQARVNRNLIRDGNYCLLVEYDQEKKRIAIHREPWWDGRTGVFIGYDTYGDMLYAVKEWDTPIGIRRTVYYEGAIERYLSVNGGGIWSPFVLSSDNQGTQGVQNGSEPIPIPYVDNEGNPMHIPFVHFSNVSDEFENYGSSYLDGGKISLQDMINDLQYDISAAARMNGYQRTWSKGYALQKVNGKTVRPKTGPGVHYHADLDTAAWGILPAGEIGELISTYKMKVDSFCRNTHTPNASITGNWPSGEALYRLEKPIAGVTLARQKRNSPAWVELFHRAIELVNVYERAGLDEDVMLTAEFTDAGDRDELSIAMADLNMWQAAAAAVTAGVPIETFLKVWGWGEDAVTGLTTDIAKQIRAKQQQALQLEQSGGANPNGSQPKASGGSATTSRIKTATTPKQKATAN